MSSSKKLTCKGTLQQVFICLTPRTPYTPLTRGLAEPQLDMQILISI
jgi:hypothetical protein